MGIDGVKRLYVCFRFKSKFGLLSLLLLLLGCSCLCESTLMTAVFFKRLMGICLFMG